VPSGCRAGWSCGNNRRGAVHHRPRTGALRRPACGVRRHALLPTQLATGRGSERHSWPGWSVGRHAAGWIWPCAATACSVGVPPVAHLAAELRSEAEAAQRASAMAQHGVRRRQLSIVIPAQPRACCRCLGGERAPPRTQVLVVDDGSGSCASAVGSVPGVSAAVAGGRTSASPRTPACVRRKPTS
jgi:hypothetical protein